MKKVRCPECGSNEIHFEAAVYWSEQEQRFEAVDAYDKGHTCNSDICNGREVDPEWYEEEQDEPRT